MCATKIATHSTTAIVILSFPKNKVCKQTQQPQANNKESGSAWRSAMIAIKTMEGIIMHRDTGEIKRFSDIPPEEADKFIEIPDGLFRDEVEQHIAAGTPVNFNGDTPLSEWARKIKDGNRSERRKKAKAYLKKKRHEQKAGSNQ